MTKAGAGIFSPRSRQSFLLPNILTMAIKSWVLATVSQLEKKWKGSFRHQPSQRVLLLSHREDYQNKFPTSKSPMISRCPNLSHASTEMGPLFFKPLRSDSSTLQLIRMPLNFTWKSRNMGVMQAKSTLKSEDRVKVNLAPKTENTAMMMVIPFQCII